MKTNIYIYRNIFSKYIENAKKNLANFNCIADSSDQAERTWCPEIDTLLYMSWWLSDVVLNCQQNITRLFVLGSYGRPRFIGVHSVGLHLEFSLLVLLLRLDRMEDFFVSTFNRGLLNFDRCSRRASSHHSCSDHSPCDSQSSASASLYCDLLWFALCERLCCCSCRDSPWGSPWGDSHHSTHLNSRLGHHSTHITAKRQALWHFS